MSKTGKKRSTGNKNKKKQNNMLHLGIKALFVVVLIGFLALIYRGSNTSDVDLGEVLDSLNSKAGLSSEMEAATDRDLRQFIGINADDYKQVIYYRNTRELAVEELLIVKTAHGVPLDAVDEAVTARVKGQLKTYASYGPSQVKQLKNSISSEIGDYYFYCTSDNADRYEEVLRNAIQ